MWLGLKRLLLIYFNLHFTMRHHCMRFSSIIILWKWRLLMLASHSWKSSPAFSAKSFYRWNTAPVNVISSCDRIVLWIFQISSRANKFDFLQTNNNAFDPLFGRISLLCSTRKKWKNRKWVWFLFVVWHLFWTGALGSLFLSIASNIRLFFGIDLILLLDFMVFLTDSLVCLTASINSKNEEKHMVSK